VELPLVVRVCALSRGLAAERLEATEVLTLVLVPVAVLFARLVPSDDCEPARGGEDGRRMGSLRRGLLSWALIFMGLCAGAIRAPGLDAGAGVGRRGGTCTLPGRRRGSEVTYLLASVARAAPEHELLRCSALGNALLVA